MLSKKDLRTYFLRLRNGLTPGEIEGRSKIIVKKILQSEQYVKSEKLFTYINFGSEVDTSSLINKALDDGKLVALPWAKPKTSDMFFLKIKSLDNLILSEFGVLEPPFDEKNIVASDIKTLSITPGVAFDRLNYRLGYGRGYYDKYFSENSFYCKMGICYDFLQIDCLPKEDNDVKLDLVINDN